MEPNSPQTRPWPAPGPLFRRRPSLRHALGVACPVLLLLLLASGCTPTPHNTVSTFGGHVEGRRLDEAPDAERIKALAKEIRALSPAVRPHEADHCATVAIKYSRLLIEAYDITEPIELNNIMVNMGLKKRGLCYELAADLCAELKDQRYSSLTFTRGIAWRDRLFDEHNTVIVTAPGQRFEDGLVLDPWRNAGKLRWARVKNDHYPWIPWKEEGQATTKPSLAVGTTAHAPVAR